MSQKKNKKHFYKRLMPFVVASFVILLLDGCITAGPYVRLGHGYEMIGGDGYPVNLRYVAAYDERTYSGYIAFPKGETVVNSVPKSEPYRLMRPNRTILEFSNESEWIAAISKYNAQPYSLYLSLDGVVSFSSDGQHIIGQYEEGYFIVDILENLYETLPDRLIWQSKVEKRTSLDPNHLKSPYWFWNQYRPTGLLAIYGFFITCASISSMMMKEGRAKNYASLSTLSNEKT